MRVVSIAVVLVGCAVPTATWKGKVEWPHEASTRLVAAPMEAGAALAAAAAIREMVRQNTSPRLFRGGYSPEQGLDAAVFKGPTPGLYYVVLDQRFERCGGPRVRVLDGWYVYAVTPQGEVVAKAPPMPGDEEPASPPRPSPPTPEQPPSSSSDTIVQEPAGERKAGPSPQDT